jgi:hypothetical protein
MPTTTTVLTAVVVSALALGTAAPAVADTPVPTPSVSAAARMATAPTTAAAPVVAVVPTPKPTVSAPVAKPVAKPVVAPKPSVPPTGGVAPMPVATPTAVPTPAVPLPVATALNKTIGHAANSRTVTMTGTQFTNLAGVQVAGAPVTNLTVLSPTQARFVLPNAADYQAKLAGITLTAISDRTVRPTGLTFEYRVTNRLDRQMAYAFQNWNVFANRTFGYLSGSDCANFASQTLLARGWKPSAEWFNDGPGDWSGTWVSSTAMSTWLKKRPDLATRLTYAQRDTVTVGDVVQLRWPGHAKTYSAWDHTGIVSKVVVLPNGRHDIYYVAHTTNRQYGGSTAGLASYYAGRKTKGSTLRIQFFHLLK